jgi:hypothetical protein
VPNQRRQRHPRTHRVYERKFPSPYSLPLNGTKPPLFSISQNVCVPELEEKLPSAGSEDSGSPLLPCEDATTVHESATETVTSLDLLRLFPLMHNLVLNMRVLDRIPDRPGKYHDVKDRSKPTGLDVRGVIPVECAHKACPAHWNLSLLIWSAICRRQKSYSRATLARKVQHGGS